MATRADPSGRQSSQSRRLIFIFLAAMGKAVLAMPRLGLDSRQGNKTCLLESLLLVKCWLGQVGVRGRRFFTRGDCGGAMLLIKPCGTSGKGEESLGAEGQRADATRA
jgi:hypothetical protein